MIVPAGSTDKSVVIRIVDSGDGTPEEGVTSATAGLALWYWRQGAAAVTGLTESDLSALDDAHSDGGLLHIDDGYYRLDLPDAAFAAGADFVQVGGTADEMVVIGLTLQIGPVPADVVEISGDATAADNLELDYDGTGLARANSTIGAVTDVTNQVSADVTAISGSSTAADNLEASALGIVTGEAVTGTLSTTQMKTDLTEATDNHYNGRVVVWTSGNLAGQATAVSAYDGTNKVLTFLAVTEPPANGDAFVLV